MTISCVTVIFVWALLVAVALLLWLMAYICNTGVWFWQESFVPTVSFPLQLQDFCQNSPNFDADFSCISPLPWANGFKKLGNGLFKCVKKLRTVHSCPWKRQLKKKKKNNLKQIPPICLFWSSQLYHHIFIRRWSLLTLSWSSGTSANEAKHRTSPARDLWVQIVSSTACFVSSREKLVITFRLPKKHFWDSINWPLDQETITRNWCEKSHPSNTVCR